MLLKFVGWFYVLFGAVYMLKPDWLKNRLKNKSTRKIRWAFFFLTLSIAWIFIKAGWGASGILPRILVVFGIIGIFKAMAFANAKAAETLIFFWLKQPDQMFRIASVGMIAFGAILIYYH